MSRDISLRKGESGNIYAKVDTLHAYGEVLKEAEFRDTFKTVGDLEHSEMIRLYIEENLGMKDIAEKLNRSSRTPLEHIHKHNNAVKRSGFCGACKRAGSPYFNEMATREKHTCMQTQTPRQPRT